MIPDSTWNGGNDPIQGPEEQALDCVPVLVGTQSVAFLCVANTEKNEDAQRQSPAISRQIDYDPLMVTAKLSQM